MQTVIKKAGFSLLAVTLAGLAGIPGLSQTPNSRRGSSATSRSMLRRGYLGVGFVEVSPERAKALGRKEEGGIEVKRVDENSPASRAGIRENDLILEVNHSKVEGREQFARVISEMAPGTRVDLVIWRNSARMNVTAALEPRPRPTMDFDPDLAPPMPPMPPEAAGQNLPLFIIQAPVIGFEGETLTSQLAEFFGVKGGVLVRAVTPNTPASRAGLKAGDVVTKVNGVMVTTTREIQALVRMSHRKNAAFGIVREKKDVGLDLEIGQ